MALWLTGHDRDFIYQPRGFSSMDEMNEEIITRYNEIVKPEDDVYVLGDLMLGNNEIGLKCIKNLKGNIHVIRGNHDTNTRMDLYNNCYNIVEICEGKFLNYKDYHFYLSHYPCLASYYDEHSPVKLKRKMTSLCGHKHTQNAFEDFDKGLIYHCEVDAHDCYPVSIEEIIKDIKEIII